MIAPLRARQRRLLLVLALLLPAPLALSFAKRPSFPRTPAPPAPARPALLRTLERERDGARLRADVFEPQTAPLLRVAFESTTRVEPDLLVYWTSAEGKGAPDIEGALFLGALGALAEPTPIAPERAASGTLFLYSLAHAEVVAWLELGGA